MIKMDSHGFLSFVDFSNETVTECNFIIDTILKSRFSSRPVKVIDVGCGAGEKIQYLKDYISSATGIEVLPDIVDFSIYNEVIIGDALSTLLPIHNRAELVVASHILPYIQESQYGALLHNLLSWTKKQGYVVMFEMTGDGIIGQIKSEILGENLITSSDKFDIFLDKSHISHGAYHISADIEVESDEEMFMVIRFFCEKYGHKFARKQNYIKREIKKMLSGEKYTFTYYIKSYVFQSNV